MAVTNAEVAKRCGMRDENDPEVGRVLANAEMLLTDALATAFKPMTGVVRDECILSICRAVYDRKKVPAGTAGGQVEHGYAIRTPRDPLASIRTILGEYVVYL